MIVAAQSQEMPQEILFLSFPQEMLEKWIGKKGKVGANRVSNHFSLDQTAWGMRREIASKR